MKMGTSSSSAQVSADQPANDQVINDGRVTGVEQAGEQVKRNGGRDSPSRSNPQDDRDPVEAARLLRDKMDADELRSWLRPYHLGHFSSVLVELGYDKFTLLDSTEDELCGALAEIEICKKDVARFISLLYVYQTERPPEEDMKETHLRNFLKTHQLEQYTEDLLLMGYCKETLLESQPAHITEALDTLKMPQEDRRWFMSALNVHHNLKDVVSPRLPDDILIEIMRFTYYRTEIDQCCKISNTIKWLVDRSASTFSNPGGIFIDNAGVKSLIGFYAATDPMELRPDVGMYADRPACWERKTREYKWYQRAYDGAAVFYDGNAWIMMGPEGEYLYSAPKHYHNRPPTRSELWSTCALGKAPAPEIRNYTPQGDNEDDAQEMETTNLVRNESDTSTSWTDRFSSSRHSR